MAAQISIRVVPRIVRVARQRSSTLSRGAATAEREPPTLPAVSQRPKTTAAFWPPNPRFCSAVRPFAARATLGRSPSHTPGREYRRVLIVGRGMNVWMSSPDTDSMPRGAPQWPVMDFVELIRELLRVVAETLLDRHCLNCRLRGAGAMRVNSLSGGLDPGARQGAPHRHRTSPCPRDSLLLYMKASHVAHSRRLAINPRSPRARRAQRLDDQDPEPSPHDNPSRWASKGRPSVRRVVVAGAPRLHRAKLA